MKEFTELHNIDFENSKLLKEIDFPQDIFNCAWYNEIKHEFQRESFIAPKQCSVQQWFWMMYGLWIEICYIGNQKFHYKIIHHTGETVEVSNLTGSRFIVMNAGIKNCVELVKTEKYKPM